MASPDQKPSFAKHKRTPSPLSAPPLSGSLLSSPVRQRPGYTRIGSIPGMDEVIAKGEPAGDDAVASASNSSTNDQGLGITMEGNSRGPKTSYSETRRTPVVSMGSPEQPSDSTALLMSSPLSASFSGSTRYEGSQGDLNSPYQSVKSPTKKSVNSLRSSIQNSVYAQSDAGLLSMKSRYDDFDAQEHCKGQNHVRRGWCSSFSATILTLAVISTVLSGIFLVIGLRGPRWGHFVHTNGPLTASSAAFLTSILAKLIELTFVTVFVAFLGQALARRAFKGENARGVTLAEMNMRTWIMQPGTVFTNWSSVRYAGVTWLGVLSLIAALVALLYTSAATALVQPQLRYPKWSSRVMQGLVKSAFANPKYIEVNCKTPITPSYDLNNSGITCIQLQHAAMGYHNYFGYLTTWTETVRNGSGPSLSNPSLRPKGFALLTDNTTITAPWIEYENNNITDLYSRHDIIINNISMAMPHPGVARAAIDPINNIMQPGDLDGLGSYNIRASVPSPVMHVLCATLNATQLSPLINNADVDPYLGGTDMDDIFQWGEAYGTQKWPPTFSMLPRDFNTIINDTTGVPWGRDSIYLLGKGGPTDSVQNPTLDQNYALCSLRVGQTTSCSTQFNASSHGGTLEARCEDRHDDLQYSKSLPVALSGNDTLSKDWPNIGSEWARSLSLNSGVTDGNASNARLLTQLILTGAPKLNPALPSIAEALAVMAGCTLLESATDAPFVEFWNYTETDNMIEGQYQYFNASVRAQEYSSGGSQDYQKAFAIVLFILFIMNIGILLYLVFHREWYTDFSEPSTLFSLAVNSPPSKELAGSCGGGPKGSHFQVSWKVNRDGDHVYMESQEHEQGDSPRVRRRQRLSEGFEMLASPVKRASAVFDSHKRNPST